MIRDEWTYIGLIDCFGLPEDERDRMFHAWHDVCVSAGGELQVRPNDNSWDSDRYDVHIVIPGSPQPIADELVRIAAIIDSDHREWTLEGYDRANFQREDLILRKAQVMRVAYSWRAEQAEPMN